MSIASEITDLQTNLTNAKSAVTAKGGTVGDTGLAGLASEIATIPSGGTLDNYGTIKYLDDNNVEQTLTLATANDFYELCNQDIYTANVHIGNTVFTKEKITEVAIADGVTFIPDNFMYNCSNLTSITLPDTVIFIGSNFGHSTKIANKLNLTNVEYIGVNFLYSASPSSYTEDIDLPKVHTIGGGFLQSFYNFNGNVNLNDGCKIIESSFMANCWNFNKSFVIPSGLETLGTDSNPRSSFMKDCGSFTGPLVCNSYQVPAGQTMGNNFLATSTVTAPMYTTGVTLTGPYAQNWKDKLPDRTSSPYRKLIVGS